MSVTRVALPHGVVAELVEGDGDAPAIASRGRAPRRWSRNMHLWESCACAECAQRRAGFVAAGYHDRPAAT